MPSLFTHYLCGDKAIEMLSNNKIKSIVQKHRQVFNLGTQGPDIFFFYRVWPWTNSQGIDNIGGHMHANNVASFFNRVLKYVKCEAGDASEVLTSYFLGLLCHYALDSTVHPYIYYKVGFEKPGEPITDKFKCYHIKFESAIDVLMLQRIRGIKASKGFAHKLIRIGNDDAFVIGKMYETVLSDVYSFKVTAKQVATAINDMVGVYAVLRDSLGMKKKFISCLEKRMGWSGVFSSNIHPTRINDEIDYLNLSHGVWRLPWDNSVEHSESFVDIFDQAVKEAVELWETAGPCIFASRDSAEAIKRIGNRSYSSGLDCDAGTVFEHYESVFES